MPAIRIPLGYESGKLTVIGEQIEVITHSGQKKWKCLCRCECGKETLVSIYHLDTKESQSCGDRIHWNKAVKHGHAQRKGEWTGAYKSWRAMKARVGPKSKKHRKNYYDRGIIVCERWMDFRNFLADMGERPEGHTLERKNVHGNYEAENCVWLPAAKQAWNKQSTVKYTVRGITDCLPALCEHFHVDYNLARSRVLNGWPIDDALFTEAWSGNRKAPRPPQQPT
jgi:hypothetical protein